MMVLIQHISLLVVDIARWISAGQGNLIYFGYEMHETELPEEMMV